MPRSKQWYYQVLGESVGPVHAAVLRSLAEKGIIQTDTLVRRTNSEWVTASSVTGLFFDDGDTGEIIQDELAPEASVLKFLRSTGDVPYKYEIIDLVFACSSDSEGFWEPGVDPIEAYSVATNLLEEVARDVAADAVINIRFETRVAHKENLSQSQVFEVYATGTAVRSVDDSWPKN